MSSTATKVASLVTEEDSARLLEASKFVDVIFKVLHAAARTYFGANTLAQIAGGSVDLEATAASDQATHLAHAPSMGYDPMRLQTSFDRLNELNQQLFNQR